MKIETVDNSYDFKIIRVLFYLLFLVYIDPYLLLSYSTLPVEFWLPNGIFSVLDFPVLMSQNTIVGLSILWKMCGVICATGYFFSIFSKIFFLLTFFIINTSHNYGYQTHTYMPLVMASFVMAFCGENKIFCNRFLFCMIYFSAGVSKLRNSGLEWITTESMQNMLLRSEIYYHDVHALANTLKLNILIAQNLLLTKIAAAVALLLEISAPLALLHRRFRLPIVGGLFALQVIIFFAIYVNFEVYILLYIFWIDWRYLSKVFSKYLNLLKMNYLARND